MQVKVWNDNVHPYTEVFRERSISIKPKGFILMEKGEAELFKGSFAAIKIDSDGRPIPEGYKMIRIEELPSAAEESEASPSFICQADGAKFDTQAELDAYVKENHSDKLVIDEEAEQAMKKRQGRRPKAS
jgi:hypothetical protein